MSVVVEKATECAACGGPIVIPIGRFGEFCSEDHKRAGRSHCKFCDKSLNQPATGTKKNYCNKLCCSRYNSMGHLSPSQREEWEKERNRSVCKCGCGRSITQPKCVIRCFYNKQCQDRYRQRVTREQELTQEWGAFRPETRKCLQQLQQSQGIAAALRLAAAINHEYTPRVLVNPNNRKIICHCKTCGKEFGRYLGSHRSRDYCIPAHDPSTKRTMGHRNEVNPNAKFTWEQIDEIRCLYRAGGISYQELGRRYSVDQHTIGDIVRRKTWRPEDDPRRKQV